MADEISTRQLGQATGGIRSSTLTRFFVIIYLPFLLIRRLKRRLERLLKRLLRPHGQPRNMRR